IAMLLLVFYNRPLLYLIQGLERIGTVEDHAYRIVTGPQADINAVIQRINQMADRFLANEIERQISDTKHRILVENSRDIIFSMNEDGIVITVNQALKEHLGYEPNEIKGKPFEMLMHNEVLRRDDVRLLLLQSRLRDVREKGRGQNLQIELMTAHGEPWEMNLRLEYIQVFNTNVFWGKLESDTEDSISKICAWERRHFQIGNYLSTANSLLNQLTAALPRYFNESDVMAIKIGLREMLINAIEHGNLGISFQEKSESTHGDRYLELVAQRQNQSPYKNRLVDVQYALNQNRVLYSIKDQGEGFDHQHALQSFKVNKDLYHGRGLAIARSIFDELHYNHKGNQVKLVKYITNKPEK
ncbi:MAG: ATP-binding protein, partial [Leptospiraceae bacterium]|nr:ATP-binding protein [Leptospiraceae bacterium]